MKKKILCVVGTRPEVIKMAPIIFNLRNDQECEHRILSTSQHRQILDQMLEVFKIMPDIDLNLMQSNQTLSQLTANLPVPLQQMLEQEKPDIVLAQGDTTTAFMVSLACFYQQIPFAHVEAGLRTGSLYDPFPEEMNRVLISRLSALNFAPTAQAKDNLLKEGFSEEKIFVTGNTVIDSLHYILKQKIPVQDWIRKNKKLILVTAHRRENFGHKLEEICQGLRTIADNNQEVQILFPVHPNPQVSGVVSEKLRDHPRILLSKPLPYQEFIKTMQLSHFIISDSGGVQEEAPALGKPVLVIRDTTERPEGVSIGVSKIIGTKSETIAKEAEILLEDQGAYQKMISKESPYGDGKASERIISIVKNYVA